MRNFIGGAISLSVFGLVMYLLYTFLPVVFIILVTTFVLYCIVKPEWDKNDFYARANQQMMEDEK